MNEVREKLDGEIDRRLDSLAEDSAGDAEKVDALSKLYALKIEEDAKQREAKGALQDRLMKLGIGTAEIVLPLIFYTVLFQAGLKFEEEGAVQSFFLKNLVGKIRPTKID